MRRNDGSKQPPCCSFCGKSRFEVRKLIAGLSGLICERCVERCRSAMRARDCDGPSRRGGGLPPPQSIKDGLDDYVIGQDRAKRVLSVAVYNHYKRLADRARGPAPGQKTAGVELSKSNILLIGPTGSGKTLLAQSLAKQLDVPFAMADATALTEAGYVGEDVEQVIVNLLRAAGGDVARAQRGIVFIDEVDKIARRGELSPINRDVSGEGVQQGLLKLIEGTLASVPRIHGRKQPQQDYLQVDTSDILFVCGGAFTGLERIVARRSRASAVGFGAAVRDTESRGSGAVLRGVEPADLMSYGLIPEFVGRLPIVVTLDDLDEAALVEILTAPKNALIKQYQCLFAMDNVRLVVEEAALAAIARKALARGSGARGLRAIVEDLLLEPMFLLPDLADVERIVIDESVVAGRAKPRLVYAAPAAELRASA